MPLLTDREIAQWFADVLLAGLKLEASPVPILENEPVHVATRVNDRGHIVATIDDCEFSFKFVATKSRDT